MRDDQKVLLFQDEARFGLISTLKRMWAKVGEPLVKKIKRSYQWMYIYSSVAPKTGEDVTYFLPKVNTVAMEIYLEKVSERFANKEVLIIMDRASWHTTKKLNIPANIELEFLPAYSPELNPVERLWKWFRQESFHNRIFGKLDNLMDELQAKYQELDCDKLSRLCHCNYL